MIVFWHGTGCKFCAKNSNEKKLKKDLGGTAFVLPSVVDYTHDD